MPRLPGRISLGLFLTTTLVLGPTGCEMLGLGGSADAGSGGAKVEAKDAGAKKEAVDLDALLPKLAAKDPGALEELKKAGKDAGHKLNEWLKSEDPKTRKAAAFAARANPGPEHSKALGPLLEKEKDADVAKTLVETLAMSGDETAMTVLAGSLGNEAVQNDVIKALAKNSGKLGAAKGQAEEGLMAIAGGKGARAEAISVLGAWKSEKAFPAMLKIAKKDAEPEVQAAALKALGRYGDAKALKKAVYPALKSKDEGVKLAAIAAVVELGDKKSAKKLKKLTKDKSKAVKKAAKSAVKALKKKKKSGKRKK